MKLTSNDIKWNEGKDYAVVSELGGVYQYSHSIANVEYAMFMIKGSNNYIVKREPLISSNVKHYPSFSNGIAEAVKRSTLRMRSLFNDLGRLASDQIKWENNATYAIVAIDDNVVEEQVDFNPSLTTAKSFVEVGDYSYSGAHCYQVKRELEQIKPTVSHCVRVYEGGGLGVTRLKLTDLGYIVEACLSHPHAHHYNNKPKFRLVYKAD